MTIGRQIAYILSRTLAEIVAVVLVFAVDLMPFYEVSLRLAAYIGVVAACKLAIYPWLLSGIGGGLRLPAVVQQREFLRYGLPMVPTLLVVWLISQGDRLVLSHFASKHDLGVYAFGASLAAYLVFLGYAVYPLLLPRASQLYDGGDLSGVRTLFQDAQRLFMLLWAGAMACLALWASEIINWTAGDAYAGAEKVLLILSLAVGVEQLLGIYQYVFHLGKRTDRILWLNLGYAAMLLSGLALAGLVSGTLLAPWAVLAVTILFNIIRYQIAQRYLPLPLIPQLWLRVAAVMALSMVLFDLASSLGFYFRLLLTGIIAGLTLVVVARRWRPEVAGSNHWAR
jgi:O-antigen/teichoic acid export membrane protein